MIEVTCAGLPASWLNAWLAAVGVTVLDPRLRLRWTTEGTPRAVLCAVEADPVASLAASWPARDELAAMPVAERWNDTPPLPRRVPVEAFVARARAARGHPHSWTLSSTLTDLSVDGNGEVAHAPLDPSGPGSTRGLHHRLLKLHRQVEPSIERFLDSLSGTAERVEDNGLGFDITRMGSQSDVSAVSVDPVVEVLAFFGLALLPVRGAGTDRRAGRSADASTVQRGWTRIPGNRREHRFMWPAWSTPLDGPAIDALLDIWTPDRKTHWSRVGVHAAWRSIRFMPRATADPTRAFGAGRL